MALVTKGTIFASNSLVRLSFGMSWEELEVRLESWRIKNPPQRALSFVASHCGHYANTVQMHQPK